MIVNGKDLFAIERSFKALSKNGIVCWVKKKVSKYEKMHIFAESALIYQFFVF